MKRNDYLSWENTFTLMSEFVALKSEMPIKKGACLVNDNNLILSLGYNGLPRGINPQKIKYDIKYYEVSAIDNAILSSRRNLVNAKLYTTHFPNGYDTKFLIQNGIKEIFYINDIDNESMHISKRMLSSAGININKINFITFETDLNKKFSFEEMYIGLTNIVAFRSKDPNTQVGACIVDNENRIISLGYNGFPFGCSDDKFPWDNEKTLKEKDTKYPYVVHAEANGFAIAQRTSPINLSGFQIFTNLFPCNNCATKIIQYGISKVNYVSDKHADLIEFASARDMLKLKHIKLIKRKNVLVRLK